uniref:Uncharacterized protein n=1 Tax=Amphimedon queenslandica TaxID=400682 RepID=A0A1X7V470_AMPQE
MKSSLADSSLSHSLFMHIHYVFVVLIFVYFSWFFKQTFIMIIVQSTFIDAHSSKISFWDDKTSFKAFLHLNRFQDHVYFDSISDPAAIGYLLNAHSNHIWRWFEIMRMRIRCGMTGLWTGTGSKPAQCASEVLV